MNLTARAFVKQALPKLPLLVCLSIFCYHFWSIEKYSVNLPYADDWVMFSGDDHPASIDARWIYLQHNEHRISTTRILIWILFRVDRWNIRTHVLVGFVIYGLGVFVLALIVHRIRPAPDSWLLGGLFAFLLTPRLWTMHFVALGVSSHLWLLFLFLTAYFLFSNSQSWASQLLGCASGIFAIYSFASGFVTVLVLVTVFSFYKIGRVARARQPMRSREVAQCFSVLAVLIPALAAWIYKLQFAPGLHLTYPYSVTFWRFYLNVIASSFGVETVSGKLGACFLLVVLAPAAVLVFRERTKLSNSQWMLIGLVLAILADLATITMGRAMFGLESSKIPEYAEHGIALIVLSAVTWVEVLPGLRARVTAIVFLWLICFATFANDWNFRIYEQMAITKVNGARCVRNYYEGIGDGQCPMTFPPAAGDLRPFLDQAKRLNASFVAELGVSQ